jgi:hypothetical protein
MKNTLYFLCFMQCILLTTCNASQWLTGKPYCISKNNLRFSQKLGNISVLLDNNGFKVKKNSQIFTVQPYCLDKELRKISKENLSRLISTEQAYVSIGINSCGEYCLELKGRLLSCSDCKKNNCHTNERGL